MVIGQGISHHFFKSSSFFELGQCRNRRLVCAANPAIPVDPAVTQLTNGNCASLELSLNLLLEFGFLSADSNSVQLMLSSS